MRFKEHFEKLDWEQIKAELYAISETEVRVALRKKKLNIRDFMALISPAAAPFLEEMAQRSQQLTRQRFGRTIQLFAPMYLSNECQNICTYCGFSLDNKIPRKTLSKSEIILEAMALKEKGIDHVLLVTGEANNTVDVDYFLEAVRILKTYFSTISIEVQPLETEEYDLLVKAGVYSVLVYQETYHKEVYKAYHPKGKKSNFDFRLDTLDRIGQSGMRKMGLGVLIGLEDWRVDSFFNASHMEYLQRTYWQSKFSVSFPRLRPAEGVIEPNFVMQDRELLQLIFAYRIWNPDLEITISTRERESFRDHIISLGATSMSAESKTNPGGYSVDPQSLEQFEISDERTVEEFVKVIKNRDYDVVFKDWDYAYSTVS